MEPQEIEKLVQSTFQIAKERSANPSLLTENLIAIVLQENLIVESYLKELSARAFPRDLKKISFEINEIQEKQKELKELYAKIKIAHRLSSSDFLRSLGIGSVADALSIFKHANGKLTVTDPQKFLALKAKLDAELKLAYIDLEEYLEEKEQQAEEMYERYRKLIEESIKLNLDAAQEVKELRAELAQSFKYYHDEEKRAAARERYLAQLAQDIQKLTESLSYVQHLIAQLEVKIGEITKQYEQAQEEVTRIAASIQHDTTSLADRMVNDIVSVYQSGGEKLTEAEHEALIKRAHEIINLGLDRIDDTTIPDDDKLGNRDYSKVLGEISEVLDTRSELFEQAVAKEEIQQRLEESGKEYKQICKDIVQDKQELTVVQGELIKLGIQREAKIAERDQKQVEAKDIAEKLHEKKIEQEVAVPLSKELRKEEVAQSVYENTSELYAIKKERQEQKEGLEEDRPEEIKFDL